jgi:hypothetical protein
LDAAIKHAAFQRRKEIPAQRIAVRRPTSLAMKRIGL